MRVLFVQQDHMSPTGPVGEAFADHGFDVQEFIVVPEEHFHAPSVAVTFPDPLAFDAIVAMGAAWSVYDRDRIGSWVGDELDFLRRAHQAGVPSARKVSPRQAIAPGSQGSGASVLRSGTTWMSGRPASMPPWIGIVSPIGVVW